MNQTAMIVSVISIVACLFLATRGGVLQRLGAGGTLRYAAIWAAIIIVLVLVIRYSGVRLGE